MNVYTKPLKDELQEAWDNGFKTYDAYSKRNFIMRVWYMYSTHDLLAYALFVGWCVHGRFSCPTCKAALEFRRLQAGGKFSCFDMHRQFLDLTISSEKTRITSSKVELSKTMHHLR